MKGQLTEIELCGYLISLALGGRVVEESLALCGSRVQIPLCSYAIQVQDGPHVILQDDIAIQAAGNQTSGLEQVVIVLIPCFLIRTLFWLGEATTLIDAG